MKKCAKGGAYGYFWLENGLKSSTFCPHATHFLAQALETPHSTHLRKANVLEMEIKIGVKSLKTGGK
jgi:hypothetical protein